MPSLDRIPAIRRLETDRPELFAVEVAGEVGGGDIENLYGLLEGAYSLHDRIDLLIRIVDHDGGAWMEMSGETAEQGRKHARRHVGRCATIGDRAVSVNLSNIFGPSPEVEHRHFEPDNQAEAWEWLGAHEIEENI